MSTPTSTAAFAGVETPNGDSSNTNPHPKHTPQESRDLSPFLSCSYPITLKVFIVTLLHTITN